MNRKANQEICESDIFWRRKLEKDYPQEMLEVRKKGIEVISLPKNIYMRRFTSIAYKIEKFIEVFITSIFGKQYNNFLSKEYKEGLFNAIYRGYEYIKKYDFSKNANPEEEIKIDIMIDEIAEFYPDPECYYITFKQTQKFNYVKLPEFINEILKENIYDLLK